MRSSPLILAFVTALAGCGGRPDPAPRTPAGDAAAALAKAPAALSGPSFADWMDRLDELLPHGVATRLADRENATARPVNYNRGLQLRYEWDTGRTIAYAGSQVPAFDRITVGVPRSGITPAFFRSRFQAIDAETVARIQAETVRQAEARGLDASAVAVARDLGAGLAQVSPIEDVPGLGDDAVWELRKNGQALHILLNGSAITLEVDLGEDPDRNKAVATALARSMIERL
ncbi:hypothetical protein [Pseudofulvimonas gallinarii]|uniref:Lipoprotein n=1 Tax=Pseudofulvimonas gallinarii TaxID=634155 RepID=A0A4S3KWR8_9GAMM|nr:hypothetical protein [Pseudofulvimonas gallinarii]TCS94051.1 hypothetical protein EDC25_12426 [Pseudofulvimonas gallinarii]THD13008.1 hypothetical protein B1808_10195 [Pseudofulvimonas gallinarii]